MASSISKNISNSILFTWSANETEQLCTSKDECSYQRVKMQEKLTICIRSEVPYENFFGYLGVCVI